MKKLVSLAVAGTLAAALVGCNEETLVGAESQDSVTKLNDVQATARIDPPYMHKYGSGEGGGIVSPYVLKIDKNSYGHACIVSAGFDKWFSTTDFKVKAVEGGYINERYSRDGGPMGQMSFVVGEDGNLYKGVSGWEIIYGAADILDVGSGNGSTFVVNESGQVFLLNETGTYLDWHSNLGEEGVVGIAQRIDVDSEGNPWVVTNDAKVYAYDGTTWSLIGESDNYKGIDIGCGNGVVYVSAWKMDGEKIVDQTVFQYDFVDGWDQLSEQYKCHYVDVDGNNNVWRVDLLGGVHFYDAVTKTDTFLGLDENSPISDIGASSVNQ